MVLDGDPGHLVPGHTAPDLLPLVPSLAQVADIEGQVICNVDSSDLLPVHWGQIATTIAEKQEDFDGFVVLHGTDTMPFTACALSFMLGGNHKPVVLTGAQRPLAEPRTDARINLVHSAICATKDIREVGLYFGSHLFRGNRATKTSIHAYDAFASPNHAPLMELGVDVERIGTPLQRTGPVSLNTACDTRVAVLSVFPGMAHQAIDAMAEAGKRVIILRGFGEGNLPQKDWPEAIRRVTDQGVHVLIASQCRTGASRPGRYAGSNRSRDAGALFIGDMTGEAAVVKAMCLLGRGLDGNTFRSAFVTSLAGEVTPGSADLL